MIVSHRAGLFVFRFELEAEEERNAAHSCASVVYRSRISRECIANALIRARLNRQYHRYCTARVTKAECGPPPAAVAVTVICEAPKPVAGATVTKVDPGVAAAVEVAIIVTVAGFGTVAGAVYSPVASMEPFTLPPLTVQVTL